jgi:hypothetical protein
MLIDGRGVVLDVQSRSIIGEIGQRDTGPMIGIDAAIFVGSEDDALFDAQFTGPNNFVVTSNLAQQLEKHRDHDAARGLQYAVRSPHR